MRQFYNQGVAINYLSKDFKAYTAVSEDSERFNDETFRTFVLSLISQGLGRLFRALGILGSTSGS